MSFVLLFKHMIYRVKHFLCYLLAVYVFIVGGIPASAFSQQSETVGLEFPASRLSEIAATYAGSAQNWPVISRMATYDASNNRFSLSKTSLEEIERFKASWESVEQDRAKYSQIISEGGRVFAAEELQRADLLFSEYRKYVQEANINLCVEYAGRIALKMQEINALITERRSRAVEARLDYKEGSVDRRRGLIGSWDAVGTGDLFQRNDGLRTGREALARLEFIDGSSVTVSENSVAIIRQSQVDRLTNRSEVEIELSSGGILTRLSDAARNQSSYRLNAGNSVTSVRSSNFWAESREGERVTLSNFDGEVLVEAEESQVRLERNQGTVVVRGQQPLAPVRLLAGPVLQWASADTVVYTSEITLSWSEVSGAAYYEVDIASSDSFENDLRTIRTTETSLVVSSLAPGLSYLQLRAYDANDLRGVNSSAVRLLKIVDNTPPPVILDGGAFNRMYALEDNVVITGSTEPGARVTAESSGDIAGPDGRFRISVAAKPAREITIEATDAAGNKRTRVLEIIPVDEETLFDLNWSVRVNNREISHSTQILVRGLAYETLDVHLVTENRTIQQRVGNDGRWAIRFRPEDNSGELIVRFVDRATGDSVAEKSFVLVP
ncbi:MAG: FecR domain-containing protein [Balneolales bacterium]|nr:FecR domain-containing protein [Balneolales bacterium]